MRVAIAVAPWIGRRERSAGAEGAGAALPSPVSAGSGSKGDVSIRGASAARDAPGGI